MNELERILFTGHSFYSKDRRTLILDNDINMRSQALIRLLNYNFENSVTIFLISKNPAGAFRSKGVGLPSDERSYRMLFVT